MSFFSIGHLWAHRFLVFNWNPLPVLVKGNKRTSSFNMSNASHFSTFKLDVQAAFFEFIGTTLFLLLGLGGIQAVSGEGGAGTDGGSVIEKVLYISMCMGFSLLVTAWLFFRVSGAVFNPNISLALLLVGVLKPVRFVLYCIAQMLGAITASALVLALTPGNLASKYVPLSELILQSFLSNFSPTVMYYLQA